MANYPTFLLTTLILSLTLSVPTHQTTPEIPTISAAPAVLPDPPLPLYTPLSPDITPLLPSPSGAAGTPGSSMPTIPSTRTPNPDMLDPIGPDTAVAPSGALRESSAVKIPIKGFFSSCCFAFSLVAVFMIG